MAPRCLLLLLTCLPLGMTAACLDEAGEAAGFHSDAGDAGPDGGGGAGGMARESGDRGGTVDGAAAGADGNGDSGDGGNGDGGSGDGGSGDGPAPDLAASVDGSPVLAWEAMPCWFTLNQAHVERYQVRCGFVQVPENRSQPATGRKVRLYVAVFSATAAAIPRAADPVVYLDGGPGGPGVIDTARMFTWFSRFVDDGREVVAIDQRGTGDSTPNLVCPDTQAVQACLDLLRSRADLAQYNTLTNADDIEDVRRALGYGPWNLLGASYGTRLALEVMRRHPAGVRSVILDSVVPPDVNTLSEVAPNFARTLAEIEAACNRHPTCGRAYPGFASRVLELDKALPFQFSTSSGPVTVSSVEMLYLLRKYAYFDGAIADLPELAESLRDRNEQIFRAYFAPPPPDERAFSDGMHYSVRCADDVPIPVTTQTAMALQALDPVFKIFFAHEQYANLCTTWNVPAAAPATFTPVRSAIPTLLLSGNFDPATPPHAAAHVSSTLENASNFVVSHGSHGNFFHDCAVPTVRGFLDNPGTRPTWQCPSTPAAIDFTVPPARLPRTTGGPNAGTGAPTPADLRGLIERLKKAREKAIEPGGPRW